MSVQTANSNIVDRLRQAGRAIAVPFGKARGGVRMPAFVPRLVEIAAVLLIAWLAMRLVFSFMPGAAPVAESAARASVAGVPQADMSVFARFDPFAASPVSAVPADDGIEAQETSLDITLNGIWADVDGTGIAILRAGTREQRIYSVGQEVMDGVILDRLYPDRAIILRGGVRESVFLENRQMAPAMTARPAGSTQAQASAQPAPTAQPPQQGVADARTDYPQGAPVSAASLSRIVALRPVRQGGNTVGYEVFPRGDGALFTRLGFLEGDQITSINGIPAPNDSERLIELFQELETARTLTVNIDRGGSPITLTIDTSGLQ